MTFDKSDMKLSYGW